MQGRFWLWILLHCWLKSKGTQGNLPPGGREPFRSLSPTRFAGLLTQPAPLSLRDISPRRGESPSQRGPKSRRNFRAIPHNSKCRYGERGAADAKPKAQIILDAAKVSAASGGNSEPKQGQRSQSARGFCPRSTMRVPQPDIIEYFGNADAVPQPPERCLSRQAGIVRCCLSLYVNRTSQRFYRPCSEQSQHKPLHIKYRKYRNFKLSNFFCRGALCARYHLPCEQPSE